MLAGLVSAAIAARVRESKLGGRFQRVRSVIVQVVAGALLEDYAERRADFLGRILRARRVTLRLLRDVAGVLGLCAPVAGAVAGAAAGAAAVHGIALRCAGI